MLGRMTFKMSFVSEQIIFVTMMSMRDVNPDNVYELWKLKLMTPPSIDSGAVSAPDTIAIRGNRKCVVA